MSKKDIFSDPESELAERFSAEYPALSRAEKQRIYSLIQQKQGRGAYDSEVTVSGVERRSGRAWQRAAGIAAAFALIAGIGGSTFFLHMNRVRSSERLAAAEQLTDDFLTAANLLTAGAQDGAPTLCFYRYSSRNSGWDGGDVHYARVSDDRFTSCGELVTFIDGLVTNEYMYELRQNGGGYFSAGIRELLSGSDDTAPVLISYCGELYSPQTSQPAEAYISAPVIVRSGIHEMTVRRDTDEPLEFHMVWNGSEWQISEIERTSE
ncbi:MAG: hypothetical protein IJM44_07235 [Ruminococcus sp.]|nr:hypothetical protein [Ruminococcus sp.]